MSLASSSRVGHYSIVSQLGVGGMGEVYRARDSRLGREVALKIMREDVAERPGRRARFELEARSVAALNHPNIVSIFDIGEIDGCPYAVSELIDGESLRVLLRRGPVAVRKLIEIAVQVADGLAAAHAAGIAHRDLKPENIMITRDGRVKILDFGIAHLSAAFEMSKEDTEVFSVHLTEPGTIIGTPNYMSPEQARGVAADYRSDQFSFGLMLYELATGKRAFEKGSTVETLSAIVREEPAPIDIKIPPPLRWIIDRCLAKESQRRYESTRDLFEDLRSLRDHLSEAYSSSELPERSLRRVPVAKVWRTVALAAIAVLICVLSAAALLMRRNTGADLASYTYAPLAVHAKQQFFPVWSPDGKAVAYGAFLRGEFHLFVRYIASPAAKDLGIHREYIRALRWSPDSRRVFFYATAPDSTPQKPKRGFYSVSVIGGEPTNICDTPRDGHGAALSPDVQHAVILCRCSKDKVSVFVSSPLGSPWHPYEPDPFAAVTMYNASGTDFAPNGKNIFLYYTGEKSEPEAWVLPFPAGPAPRRVLKDLPQRTVLTSASWMPDSRHVVFGMSAAGGNDHLWFEDTVSESRYQITTGISSEFGPAVSPNGKTLGFEKRDNNLNVISVSLTGNEIHTLLGTERNERMAAWAMKVAALAYVTDRNGPMEVWIRSGDGSSRPAVTQDNFPGSKTQFLMNPSLSPDADRVIFVRQGPDGANRDWIMSLTDGVPQRLNESATDTEYGGAWSPDGKYFAYLQISGASKAF